MAQQPKDENPDPRAKGLQRLKEAVKQAPGIYPRSLEKPEGRARRVRLCQAIQPEDTFHTLAQRHPELGTPRHIQNALITIRVQVMAGQFSRLRRYTPHEIAQAYLANLPKGYRLPTDD